MKLSRIFFVNQNESNRISAIEPNSNFFKLVLLKIDRLIIKRKTFFLFVKLKIYLIFQNYSNFCYE